VCIGGIEKFIGMRFLMRKLEIIFQGEAKETQNAGQMHRDSE